VLISVNSLSVKLYAPRKPSPRYSAYELSLRLGQEKNKNMLTSSSFELCII